MFPCNRPLVLLLYRKVVIRSLTCTTILVRAEHTKARRTLPSAHKCLLGRREERSFTLCRPGVEATVAAVNGSLTQRAKPLSYDLIGFAPSRKRKCWMDNVKEWTSLPMPELLTRASCRKIWKKISAEASLMPPSSPDDPVGQGTELN